eukprot:TRINITY_DN10954_c0_g1_i1.p2 TRINITY_DN10954_c0_g1~~TRINITY_DN10954_c0_g1_i1.p2  ORF type:complete len:209 (+),score=-20.28 TRINITY_DN10954_c0_g1_i1:463-1089(+)
MSINPNSITTKQLQLNDNGSIVQQKQHNCTQSIQQNESLHANLLVHIQYSTLQTLFTHTFTYSTNNTICTFIHLTYKSGAGTQIVPYIFQQQHKLFNRNTFNRLNIPTSKYKTRTMSKVLFYSPNRESVNQSTYRLINLVCTPNYFVNKVKLYDQKSPTKFQQKINNTIIPSSLLKNTPHFKKSMQKLQIKIINKERQNRITCKDYRY